MIYSAVVFSECPARAYKMRPQYGHCLLHWFPGNEFRVLVRSKERTC